MLAVTYPWALWKGSEWQDRQLRWSRQSVVSRDVSLPSIGVASGQQSCCPASRSGGPRTRPCGFVAGDEESAAVRVSSAEDCMFVECIQCIKARLRTKGGKWHAYAPGCD